MQPRLRIVSVAAAALLLVGLASYALLVTPGPTAMSGLIVKAGSASMRVDDQLGAHDAIAVSEVEVPDASWLVAYRVGMAGMPGALLGYVRVPAGISADVTIPIDPSIRLTPLAIISLNADRGVAGRFEFDMSRFDSSPDKPYYVDGRAVQTTITVAYPEDANSIDASP
jgi:hypothetical protein